jgi:hypothetical protein
MDDFKLPACAGANIQEAARFGQFELLGDLPVEASLQASLTYEILQGCRKSRSRKYEHGSSHFVNLSSAIRWITSQVLRGSGR